MTSTAIKRSIFGGILLLCGSTGTIGCAVDPEGDTLDEVPVEEQDVSDVTIFAEVHPDADTTIAFAFDALDGDNDPVVDTFVVGRDGGIDYGGLIVEQGFTPLEVYRALAEDANEAALEVLQRDHDRIAAAQRNGDFTVRAIVPAPAPIDVANEERETTWGQSTFSCNSFSNFKTQLGKKFKGAPGRVQRHTSSVNDHELYSPDPSTVWASGQAFSLVCNYNSAGNSSADRFRASVCHSNALQPGAPAEECYRVMLYDGQFLRAIYGHSTFYRRYWTIAEYKPSTLTSFMGIVRRD